MACKHNSVDFTYSPSAPRAGETVTFTNNSSSGEDWAWTFGDNGSSTLKSPTHVYKKPGTYRVILKVDNRSSWTATKEITVYDTIPTFVASDSVFYIYQDYTFTANAYNPYNYDLTYQWALPEDGSVVATDTTTSNSTLHVYFTRAKEDSIPVTLTIAMNGDTTYIEHQFRILDTVTNSVVFRTAEGDYRQRIFDDRAEEAKLDGSAAELLDAEQDTMQVYNGYTFRLSELKQTFPELEGFHIANRKIYYRAGGLYVANIDGSYEEAIDATECAAMTLDTKDSRIYWANENGVWYMPFVGSDNNKFVTIPTQLNEVKEVSKIAADKQER